MTRALLARTLLVFFLSAPVVAAQAPAPTPQNVTLAEAVRMALEKNPTVQAADAYARSVHEGIGEAKAARLPRVDFSEGFTRGNNPVYVFGGLLTQRQFTAGDFAGAVCEPPVRRTAARHSWELALLRASSASLANALLNRCG